MSKNDKNKIIGAESDANVTLSEVRLDTEEARKEEAERKRVAKYRMMTEEKVPDVIVKLSIPTIISMLVTAFYNSADTFFVGRISNSATAAVGIVFSVMAIIQAFGFMCGHGSGNYMARMLGAGETKEASDTASTGFAMSLIIGAVLAALGIIFREELAVVLGATKTSMKDTIDYMTIILLAAPVTMAQFVVNNQLRFQGSAVYAMVGLMAGAVINVGLDPLFIFGFHMGVRGAALATVSGQLISFIVLFIGSRKGGNIKMHLRNVHLNFHYIKEILNGGLPSLFRQGLAAAATMLLNSASGRLGGDAAIAGMSIVSRTMLIVSCALIGFGQGFQPVCSFNYGAGLKNRVREGYFFCVRIGTVFLSVMAVLCFVFSAQIVRFFRNSDDVVAVGKVALRYQAVTLPLMATIVITNMLLQSIGMGVRASVTASARSGIFFIPLILTLPHFFGITGVEVSQAIADACAFILAIPLVVPVLRGLKKPTEASAGNET